ncbi:MAG: hypothetical protein ACRD16_01925 [Thermoanaerobaculia bacterium]
MVNLEPSFEDYTGMNEGEIVEGGVIALCPRCGRLGRFSDHSGKKVYEHRRTSPEETRETCVL